MLFELTESACVAKGTFNIYIFRPDYIAEIIGVKPLVDLAILADFERPGFQVSCEKPKVSWTIRPDGISVRSPDGTAACGDHIATVLNKLPVTPMQAVGSNFVFRPIRELDFTELPGAAWITNANSAAGSQSVSLGQTLKREDAEINITLVVESNVTAEIRVNVHRGVAFAHGFEAAARLFSKDVNTAKSIIEELFHWEVA